MNFKKLFKKDSIAYKRGDKFFIYNDDEKIYFSELEDISTKTTINTEKNVYLTREFTVELAFKDGGLLLKAETNKIEQYKLLSELADDIERFKGIAPKGIYLPEKSTSSKYNYLWLLLLPFALNGMSEMFFDTSIFKDNSIISGISMLSGMMLSIWIVTAPMYWFVHKINMRKLQREDDFVQGRESSVKDIDFTNFILLLLMSGLIYLIYKVGVS